MTHRLVNWVGKNSIIFVEGESVWMVDEVLHAITNG